MADEIYLGEVMPVLFCNVQYPCKTRSILIDVPDRAAKAFPSETERHAAIIVRGIRRFRVTNLLALAEQVDASKGEQGLPSGTSWTTEGDGAVLGGLFNESGPGHAAKLEINGDASRAQIVFMRWITLRRTDGKNETTGVAFVLAGKGVEEFLERESE